jgi:hypothetical protein
VPFEEEYDDLPEKKSKTGLKNISSQKSIFENSPKKPSQEDLDKKANAIYERGSTYKMRAAELALQFNRAMADKTLKANKTIFSAEIEQELLTKMIGLAIDINADPAEQEDMGSLSWITLLLRTCFAQRDRANYLEYAISQIDKKIESAVSSEVARTLDKSKTRE